MYMVSARCVSAVVIKWPVKCVIILGRVRLCSSSTCQVSVVGVGCGEVTLVSVGCGQIIDGCGQSWLWSEVKVSVGCGHSPPPTRSVDMVSGGWLR